MASAFVASAFASAASQVMTNGTLNFGDVLTAGAVSAVTAGLTRGITFSDADGLGFSMSGSSDSLANLAGANPSIAEGLASNAVSSTASDYARQLAAMAGVSAIQAGVQTAIQGGSFLEALKGSGVSNLGAALAFQIGELNEAGGFGDGLSGGLAYVAAHAALGCAGAAALGSDCAGGAIGASISAALTPDLIQAMGNGSQPLAPSQRAALTMLAGLAGAFGAGAFGSDANAGAFWAQNEATNNAEEHPGDSGFVTKLVDALISVVNWRSNARAWITHQFRLAQHQQSGETPPADANPLTQENDRTPPTAGGKAVSSPTVVCFAAPGGGGCVMGPPSVGGGAAPSGWTLSSGTGEDSRSVANNRLPSNDSQLSHIFREEAGHFSNTPENQRALINLVNNQENLLGTDRFGNQWFARVLSDGTQLWGSVRNGVIQNGGLNATPRIFNPVTGLSRAMK
jgi:filamentous hemagglutinin